MRNIKQKGSSGYFLFILPRTVDILTQTVHLGGTRRLGSIFLQFPIPHQSLSLNYADSVDKLEERLPGFKLQLLHLLYSLDSLNNV